MCVDIYFLKGLFKMCKVRLKYLSLKCVCVCVENNLYRKQVFLYFISTLSFKSTDTSKDIGRNVTEVRNK